MPFGLERGLPEEEITQRLGVAPVLLGSSRNRVWKRVLNPARDVVLWIDDRTAAVRRREHRGSELLERALPRGVWDVHLVDRPGLRDFAFGWFHNIGGHFIRDDLVGAFGARQGPYGHMEPVLDDDWPLVDRAAPILDGRFAAWLAAS